MHVFRKIALVCLLASPFCGFPSPAQAQSADTPVRLIVPYPAGGGTDFLARSLSGPLSDVLHQPVNVENSTDATPEAAIKELVAAKPDGRAVLLADNGLMVFAPLIQSSISYNPETDLKPISFAARFPLVLAVKPDAGFKTLDALVQAMKASPGAYKYGSAGSGTPHHVAMALFNQQAGVNPVHVPSRGASASLISLLAGNVNVIMVDTAAAAGLLRAGKIHPLAVANEQRVASLPDVPTLSEAGYPGVSVSALVGLLVPAQTPDTVADALGKQVNGILKTPEMAKKLQAFGIETVAGSAAEFVAAMASERENGRTLVEKIGFPAR